ncbi:hypothetical protein PFISCL1PPCAC_8439, partial [Pristionchus fissidentatus]
SMNSSSGRRFPGVSRTLSSGRSAPRKGKNTSRGGTGGGGGNTSNSVTNAPIIEGRSSSKGKIGLAAIDLTTMDFHLFSFVDSASYASLKTQLQVLEPVEIIVCDSINERHSNAVLHEAMRSACDYATIEAVQRRYFDGARGLEMYRSLRARSDPSLNKKNNFAENDLCLAAFAALVKYIEHIEGFLFASASIRITFHEDDALCVMDAETWENLRVIDRSSGVKGKDLRTIFSIIASGTLTVAGARLLRASLLQPLADDREIAARADAVEEMLEKPYLLERARSLLACAQSIDCILPVIVKTYREKTVLKAEHRIVQLVHLRQTLQLVERLRQLLPNFTVPIIASKAETLLDDRMDEIRSILDETLNLDVMRMNGKKNSMDARNQKIFAIKGGLSTPLDVARKAYEELLRDLHADSRELDECLPDQNVQLAYSASRQFHYVWITQEANRVAVPHNFINIVRNKASLTFSSRHLMRFNDRIEQSVCEIMLESDDVISEAIDSIRPHVEVLYTLIDTLSTLDFLCALVVYATERDTVRPSFGNSIIIKAGRYPLLDVAGKAVVPNDTYLTPSSRFALITGPNMAGKSTYTRQVGALALLAQIGSFIPAEAASLPIFKRISSRVGQNDTLAENLSSFAQEMTGMAAILGVADEKTLVMVDELARSTSVEEGIGISYAIIEELIERKCFVVFTSHFLDLATLDASYAAVENFHFAPQIRQTPAGEVLDPSHTLYRGSYAGPLYGFEVAELAALPPSMIDRARSLAERLHEEWRSGREGEEGEKNEREILRCAHAFRALLLMPRSATTKANLLQV